MAFWQYLFWAIPEQALIKQHRDIPESIAEDEFNDINWFDNSYWISDFIEKIDHLQANTHWDKKAAFFGDYDTDRIAIMFDNGVVNEIKIGIDLKNQDIPILDKIVKLLNENDLMVINPTSDLLIKL